MEQERGRGEDFDSGHRCPRPHTSGIERAGALMYTLETLAWVWPTLSVSVRMWCLCMCACVLMIVLHLSMGESTPRSCWRLPLLLGEQGRFTWGAGSSDDRVMRTRPAGGMPGASGQVASAASCLHITLPRCSCGLSVPLPRPSAGHTASLPGSSVSCCNRAGLFRRRRRVI